MAPHAVAPASPAADARAALDLVGDDPTAAELAARAAVTAARESHDRAAESTAWRARGLAARELGRMDEAEEFLSRAVAVARKLGGDPLAEARMSLAFVRLTSGRVADARRLARLAVAGATGERRAQAQVQQALILQRTGALTNALAAYDAAAPALRRAGDRVWEARLLNNRGILQMYAGRPRAAAADLTRAETLYAGLGQGLLAAEARWNRGLAAARAGDAVEALGLFDAAAVDLRKGGVLPGVELLDRCEVLNSVGLYDEARRSAERAVAALATSGISSDLAEAQLQLAETALAAGDRKAALEAARAARTAFREQGRARWVSLAEYAELRAEPTPEDVSQWLARAEAVARSLAQDGWEVAAADVRLLAARRAAAAGERIPTRVEAQAQRTAAIGSPAQRVRAWHTVAVVRLAGGDRTGALRALSAGLRVHEASRAVLTATELRAHAGAGVEELAATGLRLALDGCRARDVLAWAERLRAGTLRARPVRPPQDQRLADLLGELRTCTHELSATDDPDLRATLQRRQVQLENAVRARARTVRWEVEERRPSSAAELVAAVEDAALVEYAAVGDELVAVTVVGGRARLHRIGGNADVMARAAHLRFLQQRAVTRPTDGAVATLDRAARELDDLLLRPLLGVAHASRLVVVPIGPLHAVPWLLLPTCAGRPVDVTPSATSWLAARHASAQQPGRVTAIAGPGLPGADAEVGAVAASYGARTSVLTGGAANVADALLAMDGAGVVHVAAHGHFRADNPLFSALQLADGRLTVYDVETLRRAPHVVVLSACNSGLSAVRPGDELMGLSAAFLRLGTRALVASLVAVPDDTTYTVMADFHRLVAGGAGPSEALAQVVAARDGVERACAASFLSLGAG